ncbi:MAG: hypothetical protein KO202_00545 [Methanobacteriaceae archaeon]|jgi:hypothetical protein|nr:hypothetical protein [Methanobacteriaceae archaeon]
MHSPLTEFLLELSKENTNNKDYKKEINQILSSKNLQEDYLENQIKNGNNLRNKFRR